MRKMRMELVALPGSMSGSAPVKAGVYAIIAYRHYPHMDIKLVGTAPTFIHRDHLSSVRIVTDALGNLVEETAYAAYGERTNAAMTTQKGTINERHDPETGLMYLNARTMSPHSAGSSHPMIGIRSRKESGRTDTHTRRTVR